MTGTTVRFELPRRQGAGAPRTAAPYVPAPAPPKPPDLTPAEAPPKPPPTDGRPGALARRLALAHLIERLVVVGTLHDYAAAARLLGITRARMTQVMDLLLIPFPIQEAVLVGGLRLTERRAHKLRLGLTSLAPRASAPG